MRDMIEDIRPAMLAAMAEIGIAEDVWSGLLAGSTDAAHADVAMPCHTLAQVLRKTPVAISDDIENALGDSLAGLAYISTVNGFLNFTATPGWLTERVTAVVGDERLNVGFEEPRTIVIDYSSPNVAKRMHVGHLRSTVIGDALARMLAHKGHEVIGENHIGDWGTPFGMLIEHYLDFEELEVDDIDLSSFYKGARAKFDRDSEFAERSRNRVVKLQSRDQDTMILWRKLVNISLVHFNEVYELLGVLLTDDDLAGESKYEELLSSVVERLEEAGMLDESDGAAVVFAGGWVNREGEPLPLIIKKADGGFNYATTDLACIIDRVEVIGSTEFLYVVGAEQAQHFAMVFEVAREAGFMDDSVAAIHIPFGMVLGTDGKKLASRGGQAISLKDLLEEAIRRAEAAILEKNPELPESELRTVAEMIGVGAVKYADLSTERTKNYVFDWNRMLSFEGNTAPYLQYAHARICSIFRRANLDRESARNASISLNHPNERSLARAIIGFAEALDDAIDSHSPHRLATYLHGLAQSFASFYESCPVLIAEDEATRASRLALCDGVARVLENGLGLLGIDVPERM